MFVLKGQVFLIFLTRQFKQIMSGVSSNYGSQLDCVFANNLTCSCSIYESYCDHKPMLISLRTVIDDCSTSTMDCQPMISYIT